MQLISCYEEGIEKMEHEIGYLFDRIIKYESKN